MSNPTAHAEYQAGLTRLARLQTAAPERFTQILFDIGLPHASQVLDDLPVGSTLPGTRRPLVSRQAKIR